MPKTKRPISTSRKALSLQKNQTPPTPNLVGPAMKKRPRPSRLLMGITRLMSRAFGLFGIPFLRHIPWLNKIGMVRGVLNINRIVIDGADKKQLQEATSKAQATFLAPNHPEIFGDFLMDWEINCRFGGRTYFWAGPDLVHGPLRHIWLRHNLIANTRDGFGKKHSIDSVLKGDNVLMHAEGDVNWTRDTVHGLFGGIAQLACRAADEGEREVWIQPLLYKSAFSGPTDLALHAELGVLEKRLALPSGAHLAVSARFAALRISLLSARRAHYGLQEREVNQQNYSAEHAHFFDQLLTLSGAPADDDYQSGPFAGPHGSEDDVQRVQLRERLRRASKLLRQKSGAFANWSQLAWELRRLYGESNATYDQDTLRAEHIAESCKRIKEQLFTGRLTDPIRSMIPETISERVVLVRAPTAVIVKPLSVADQKADQSPALKKARENAILEQLWSAMQSTLDTMDSRLDELTTSTRYANPLAPPARLVALTSPTPRRLASG